MYSFKNDYAEGAHPNILKALVDHNGTQEEGYGLDRYSLGTIAKIQELVGDRNADVHLLSGGTQTNLIAISSFLRPHEACITASSGHIATHEAGAIEATGHKLLTVISKDGKITPKLIEPVLVEHHFEHMVKPRLVYISNPTEVGTVYSFEELQALYAFCQSNDLLLYGDGARLGCALVSESACLSFESMYRLTDAFFIGGTKIGALFGEALVIKDSGLRRDFRYLVKQRGGLLAKGRALGVQFEELFKNDLYLDLARHANQMAQLVATALEESGCSFWIESPTNQIFPILPNNVIEELSKLFHFYVWAKIDGDHSAIRLVTSWATPEEAVQDFIQAYHRATKKLVVPA